MAVQTVTPIARAGNNIDSLLTNADAGGTEKWAGTGKEFVYIYNNSGGSITATITIQTTVDGVTVSTGKVITCQNTHRTIAGPFPSAIYNDTNGNVNLTWSATSSVQIAVVQANYAPGNY